ncbi:hypothetical protein J6590_106896, partial [Homalodisca vitripennis]
TGSGTNRVRPNLGQKIVRERLRVTAPRESPRMSSLSRHRADTTRCYCKYTSNRHAPRQHRAARLLNRHHHRAV